MKTTIVAAPNTYLQNLDIEPRLHHSALWSDVRQKLFRQCFAHSDVLKHSMKLAGELIAAGLL